MATPATGRPRGRPPKTTTQKRAEGNLGKRKLPQSLTDDTIDTENAPESPGLKEDALRMWVKIWQTGVWLNIDADYYAVLDACRNFEEFEFLRREKEMGIFTRTYRTPQGQILAHPKVAQLNQARNALSVSLSEIGFTPAGRARLEMSALNDSDPMERMQNIAAENKAEMMAQIQAMREAIANE
jgi:P27 family predicted phage terminase small subunit